MRERKLITESEATNADEQASDQGESPTGSQGSGDGVAREQVLDALRNVYDPELGINVVDLGLIYEVNIDGGAVAIQYSLTTMGCPIGPLIEQQMQEFVAQVPGIDEVNAEFVLRPPWSPEMMSDEAKAALGVF